VVKVVLDQGQRAMYFSRAPIPWLRDEAALERAAEEGGLRPEETFLRHVGIYAYRVSTLLSLSQTRPAPLELAEKLEQLRALWLGMKIQVALVPELPAPGVDTEADAKRVQALFEDG
jgi:3-deoxy-manno-octulosonate cytidylyltransferase (CMP-KDO synthetase)